MITQNNRSVYQMLNRMRSEIEQAHELANEYREALAELKAARDELHVYLAADSTSISALARNALHKIRLHDMQTEVEELTETLRELRAAREAAADDPQTLDEINRRTVDRANYMHDELGQTWGDIAGALGMSERNLRRLRNEYKRPDILSGNLSGQMSGSGDTME
jgi:archaellum component FlaC